MATKIRYRRPKLYPKQESIIFTDSRYSVIEASTKTGKTVGCIVWLHEQAALYGGPGRNYWWVAPIFPQAKIAFTRLKKFLPDGMYTSNKSELSITLLNGSTIWFKSGHDPDSLYGEDVYAVVVDEATRVKEESWIAVRSTLTATRGPARIIGNVKGRKNWAYRYARRAESGEPNMAYSRLTAWDAVEGGILDAEEVKDAKRMLPEQAFNELYLAIPGDDGSNPFGRQAISDCTRERPSSSFPHVFGVDLARGREPGSDYSVITGLDARRHYTTWERFQLPWGAQLQKISKVVGNVPTLVDKTGVGDPVVEQLQSRGGNVEGFHFSAQSRQGILESLAIRISSRDIFFPPETADELDNFEYVYKPTGVQYRAPEGLHDDTVMSLALANHHHDHGGGFNMRFLD